MANRASVQVSSISPEELRRMVGPDPFVVLVGSGASIWEPTALPSGQQFTSGMYDALFNSNGPALAPAREDADWLRTWFQAGDPSLDLPAVPFEVLMERCPRPEPLQELICRLYSTDGVNPVHLALARLTALGRVHSVVTTNYDCGLDSAFQAVGAQVTRVVREADAAHQGTKSYFKVHGSASAGDGDTIVHRLRFEGALPSWKRALLANLVRGRVVLVVGYSGLDFDVCPELCVAGPRAIVWNFLTEKEAERSPGLGRIEGAGLDITVTIGDMRLLISQLGAHVDAKLARPTFDIASVLRSTFTSSDLLLWRSRVLGSMGFARLAIKAADALGDGVVPVFEVRQARAQGRFHAGLYRSSAAFFEDGSRQAPDARLRCLGLLDASDAERCAGRYRRARTLIDEAKASIPVDAVWAKEVEGVAELKLILVERDVAIMSGRMLLPGGRKALAQTLRPKFQKAASHAVEAGRWFDFQQLGMWASRVGLPLEDLRPPGGYEPPATRTGYRHLGYPVAVAMDACDRARNGLGDAMELEGLLGLMVRFGCAPQAWKVAHALIRRDVRALRTHTSTFLTHFSACEYSVPLRIAWLLRGS